MKTYLHVKFKHKDKVKNLGARWDPARKAWYVPDGVDLTPFLQWVPNLPRLSPQVKRVLRLSSPHQDRRSPGYTT
jgi:exodeoxyribonuclease VII large subunit